MQWTCFFRTPPSSPLPHPSPSSSAMNWKLIFLPISPSPTLPPSYCTWTWFCSCDVKNKTFPALDLFVVVFPHPYSWLFYMKTLGSHVNTGLLENRVVNISRMIHDPTRSECWHVYIRSNWSIHRPLKHISGVPSLCRCTNFSPLKDEDRT